MWPFCQPAEPLANPSRVRHIEDMPIPVDFLRSILGLLCVFFAHFLGRSVVRVRRGLQRPRHLYGWLLRTLVTLVFVFWHRGWDGISIAVLTLVTVTLVLGIWDEHRPKEQEDLTKQIFGE
jgi:hypothetical protein